MNVEQVIYDVAGLMYDYTSITLVSTKEELWRLCDRKSYSYDLDSTPVKIVYYKGRTAKVYFKTAVDINDEMRAEIMERANVLHQKWLNESKVTDVVQKIDNMIQPLVDWFYGEKCD